MSRTLVVNVHLHEARYHGVPDWPPAPARLFQAFVAGAAKGDELAGESMAALEWLERLGAHPEHAELPVADQVPLPPSVLDMDRARGIAGLLLTDLDDRGPGSGVNAV